MDRRKLEYMLKRLTIDDLKQFKWIIGLYETREFGRFVCEYLRDPSKKDDPFIATEVPEVRNSEALRSFHNRYCAKFMTLNDLCIANDTRPIFPHPEDLTESELIREDIIALHPEEELNAFFGVSSYDDYIPPKLDE